MNKLTHLLLREVVVSVGACVGVFLFVLLTGNAVRDILALLAGGQISIMLSLQLVLLLIPYVAVYALPMGFLAGILLALGRLSASREIIAMKAAGISVTRMARPILLLALLGTVAAAWFTNEMGPRNQQGYRERLALSFEDDPLRFFQEGEFIRSFPGYMIYLEERNEDQLRGFWIWELDAARRAKMLLRAESATILFHRDTAELELRLQQGRLERLQPDPTYRKAPELGAIAFFEEMPLRLNLRELMQSNVRGSQGPSRMTLGELQSAIRNHPENALPYRVQIQQNFAMSLSVFSLSLLAIPLGIRVARKETLANLGLALFLAFTYYFLMVLSTWFSDKPAYHPQWLAWIPNALFLLLGFQLLCKANRH